MDRKSKKGLILLIFLCSHLGILNAQTEEIDTSDYIPFYYSGSLESNLLIAASKGYDEEVSRLISKGADVNVETNEGATALIFAVYYNHLSTVKKLISLEAEVNKITINYETPLLIAVKNENLEISEALIRAGADIDFGDNNGATALHYAAVYGYFYLTDLLLFYEADIDKKALDGTTPLMAAIMGESPDVADLLIQHGANVEAKDGEGFTPFLIATQTGDTMIMNLLLKTGVDIYEKNNHNWDALAISIKMNQYQATELLLSRASGWGDPGRKAIDPYLVASEYRRKEAVMILERAGIPGKVNKKPDQIGITLNSKITSRDIYSGLLITIKQPFINGGILAGIDTKLWYTRVLIKNGEKSFYQYLDKSSVLYAGIFKDFAMTDNHFGSNFSFTGSLSAAYTFGNNLKGTDITPANKFMIIPSAGLKWNFNRISATLAAEYMKSEFYRTGPVWIRLGISYNYFFEKVRAPGKTIKWY